MKVQIKPGFLFPTQFWTVELNENIEQLQNEAYLIRKNDKDGVRKSNAGYQGYHSKDIRDLNNLPGTNQLLKQIINAVNSIHQISRQGDLQLTNFWINISGKGSSNTPHTHSGLTYSGVFFIKVPKEMKGGRFLFIGILMKLTSSPQNIWDILKKATRCKDMTIRLIQFHQKKIC